MEKRDYWFWISNIEEIWQTDIKKMIRFYGDPEEVFKADPDKLSETCGLNYRQIVNLVEAKNTFKRKQDELEKKGIRFISLIDPNFPDKLKDIKNNPYAIYLRGNLPDQNTPSVGMVGARACSGYGKKYGGKIAEELAHCGIQIISGMALGIDSVCAKGAIKGNGKTFAVLGSGIDVIYPAQNYELYYEIIRSGGGIISEYPPGTPAVAWQFPHRNRIISGLSDKLIIVEARKKSGTLITASHALDQGRDIYALPGRLGDPLSEGCNQLISDGAGIFMGTEYFLNDLPEKYKISIFSTESNVNKLNGLRENAVRIYELMGTAPMTAEEISAESLLNEVEVNKFLYELILNDLAEEVSKGEFVKKNC